MPVSTELPIPDPAAQAASQALATQIRERIHNAGGWLSFADYMELALYSPGLGYYSGGAEVFGAAGDFLTAPELSPDFAACIARAIGPLLQPGDRILEIGAGSGALAAGLLQALGPEQAPAYCILERSGELRDRQQQRLAGLPVRWLDDLPAGDWRGVILANEVLDALPVRRFTHLGDRIEEWGVTATPERFGWACRPADEEFGDLVRSLHAAAGPWSPGYSSEVSTLMPDWVSRVAASLDRGLLLLFDYGLPAREFYHPERRDGTLVCHYRHRVHDDPFFWPGLQDLSAWVDFSAVSAAARAAGLELLAFSTQANFLLANGVLDLPPEPDSVRQAQRASALRQLLLPGEMGEKFKLMALGRGLDGANFDAGRDLRTRL